VREITASCDGGHPDLWRPSRAIPPATVDLPANRKFQLAPVVADLHGVEGFLPRGATVGAVVVVLRRDFRGGQNCDEAQWEPGCRLCINQQIRGEAINEVIPEMLLGSSRPTLAFFQHNRIIGRDSGASTLCRHHIIEFDLARTTVAEQQLRYPTG